jgi:hypothetical protein
MHGKNQLHTTEKAPIYVTEILAYDLREIPVWVGQNVTYNR